jgi:hypothetical protein
MYFKLRGIGITGNIFNVIKKNDFVLPHQLKMIKGSNKETVSVLHYLIFKSPKQRLGDLLFLLRFLLNIKDIPCNSNSPQFEIHNFSPNWIKRLTKAYKTYKYSCFFFSLCKYLFNSVFKINIWSVVL